MTQLDLFDGAAAPAASPETAHSGARDGFAGPLSVSKTPPKAAERGEAVIAPAGVPIPARCPVTGGRTCHRAACRYYRRETGGLCAHPEASVASRR